MQRTTTLFSTRFTASLALAAGLLAGVAAMPGCVGYGTYPGAEEPIEGAQDPNQPNAERVMTEALSYVMHKYRGTQMGQPLAVNCPQGMRKVFYERVAKAAGPGVVPLTKEIAESKSMPIYHVGRIWLRHRDATVDIFRPTTEIGTVPGGEIAYQCITVRLEGGFQPWRVYDSRTYDPGIVAVPAYYFIPDEDRPDEFRRWRESRWPKPVAVDPETGQPSPQLVKPAEVQPAEAAPKPAPKPEPKPVPEVKPESIAPPPAPPAPPKPAPKPEPKPEPVAPIPPAPVPAPAPAPAPQNPGDLVPIPPAK